MECDAGEDLFLPDRRDRGRLAPDLDHIPIGNMIDVCRMGPLRAKDERLVLVRPIP